MLWDELRLLAQTMLAFNLLQETNVTLSVSAHAHLCVQPDYNNAKLLKPMEQSAEVLVKWAS